MLKDKLKRLIPAPLKPAARKIYFAIKDESEILQGKRDRMTPPERLFFVGPGDYKRIGEEFFTIFKDPGGLKPSHRVLDVGCGIGRMAVPLTRYLDGGSYEGFDIVADGIDWCSKHITRRFPHFRFQQADVYNQHYHPEGRFKASEYRFPFDDNSFDFVFMTSVFTHMIPADLENYFSEVARVMKPGGRCLLTYFLLDDEARRAVAEGRSTMNFVHQMDGYKTIDPNDPEACLAYEEKYIMDLYPKHGLCIEKPIHYGNWFGRDPHLSYQDIIVAVKE